MMLKLQELLSKYPKAVKAIDEWCNFSTLGLRLPYDASRVTREYAYKHNILRDDCGFLSLADLLAAIEAHITATEPLSDEAIEAMKWNCKRDCKLTEVGTLWLKESHNADIDRLHAEIRRLRKGDA